MKQLVKITNPGEFAVPDLAQHYGRAVADALERSSASDRFLILASGHGLEIALLGADEAVLTGSTTPVQRPARRRSKR